MYVYVNIKTFTFISVFTSSIAFLEISVVLSKSLKCPVNTVSTFPWGTTN